MYSSSVQQNSEITKSPIKNQNTQLTEKSVGITIQIFPDYPTEKSQYPINKQDLLQGQDSLPDSALPIT